MRGRCVVVFLFVVVFFDCKNWFKQVFMMEHFGFGILQVDFVESLLFGC